MSRRWRRGGVVFFLGRGKIWLDRPAAGGARGLSTDGHISKEEPSV
jgi:hypothetical protein